MSGITTPQRVWFVHWDDGDWTVNGDESEVDESAGLAQEVIECLALPVAEFEAMRRELEAGRLLRERMAFIRKSRAALITAPTGEDPLWVSVDMVLSNYDAATKGGG